MFSFSFGLACQAETPNDDAGVDDAAGTLEDGTGPGGVTGTTAGGGTDDETSQDPADSTTSDNDDANDVTDGDADEPRPTFESGSRLRARVFETESHGRILRWWEDTDLETRCDFAPAADGQLRCLPRGAHLFDEPAAVYADAACTIAVARPSVCESSPSFILRNCPDCAEGQPTTSVYAIAATDRGMTYYRSPSTGACTAGIVEPFVQVGREIEPTAFVAAHDAVAPGDGERIVPVIRTADDGATQVIGAFDIELQTDVVEPSVVNEALVWFPTAIAGATLMPRYLDDRCTERLARATVDEPVDFVIDAAPVENGCLERSVFELGASVPTMTNTFSIHPESADCLEHPNPVLSPGVWFEIGAPALFEEVAVVERNLGDVVEETWGTPGGQPIEAIRWRDAGHDVVCQAAMIEDGSYRCIPQEASIEYHLDPACTQPIATFYDSSSLREPCGAPTEPRFGSAMTFSCLSPPTVHAVHELGPELHGLATIYSTQSIPGECVPFSLNSQQRVFELGRAVPLSSFPRLADRIE